MLVRCNLIPRTSWFAKRSVRKQSKGEQVVRALKILGPAYIKLGQSLSSRVDIVGEDVSSHLLGLCDKLPPFPKKVALKIIEGEFGQSVENIFAEIGDEPIAAASVAQVYKATLLTGEIVAVKVLRPRIEVVFARDISLFRWIATILSKFQCFKRLRLVSVIELFAEICRLEWDLRFEAANYEELSENTRNDSGFRVPRVYWGITFRRVMTTEWIKGRPIYEMRGSPHASQIAKNLVFAFCNQSYRDRFFHADMHPGNLLVDESLNIVAVDCGIMGRLDRATGIYVAEILFGFLRKDYKHVAEMHFKAGYVDPSYSNFISACRAIGAPIVGESASNISAAKLLSQLFKVTADFNMPVQPQLALLQKTMILIEGACRMLNPEINVWEIAECWMKEHRSQRSKYLDQITELPIVKTLSEMPLAIKKINSVLDMVLESRNATVARKNYKLFIILLILSNAILYIYMR